MPTLVDQYGRPIEKKELLEEVATVSLTGVRSPWRNSVANVLTPDKLAAVVVGVDNNDPYDYLTLAEEMEERDLHYRSVLWTRKAVIQGLPCRVEAVSDDSQELKIAEFVNDVVHTERFESLLFDLMDAIGKGFSVVEIMWDLSGQFWVPKNYEWVDPRFCQFDQLTGKEIRLRDDSDYQNGIPLTPYKFVRHKIKLKSGLPIRSGLARLALVAYMAKSYTLRDWLAFIEVFGAPLRLGKYPSGATAAEKSTLLRAVANIGTDAAAIIPDSMMIEFVDGGKVSNSGSPFQGMVDWLDKQVSKGVLGQTMTADDGASLSQANIHNEVRHDIMVADKRQLEATIQRDLIRPLVDLNFGPRKVYPTFQLLVEDPEDLEALSRALPPFIDRGLKIQASVIRDKFGLPEPDDGAELLGSKVTSPSNNDGEEDNDDEGDIASVRRALLSKVRRGETLTTDQRILLVRAMEDEEAIAAKQAVDELDRLTLEAIGKPTGFEPLLDAIVREVQEAQNPEEALAALQKLEGEYSHDEFVQALAIMTYKARAIGDVRDKA